MYQVLFHSHGVGRQIQKEKIALLKNNTLKSVCIGSTYWSMQSV